MTIFINCDDEIPLQLKQPISPLRMELESTCQEIFVSLTIFKTPPIVRLFIIKQNITSGLY